MTLNPMVSVIVITYNSGKYILELLNSIYEQKYKNIELIISDDCSNDDTIEKCQKWLNFDENRTRFSNVVISKKSQNEGITYNYNNGFSYSRGEYIKFIEGDDLLEPECISDNIDYIQKYRKKIIFSKAQIFGENVNCAIVPKISPKILASYTSSSEKTYKRLLKSNFIVNPTVFFERSLIETFGGFDNSYKMLVDYPFFIKIAKSGEEFGFMDKITVKYRQHENNLSKSDSQNKKYISEIFYNDLKKFYMNELKLYVKDSKNILTIIEVWNFFYVMDSIIKNGNTSSAGKSKKWLSYLCFWVKIRKVRERIAF